MPEDRWLLYRDAVAEVLAGGGRAWLREAACIGEDPELFFPLVERETDARVAEARAVCRRCRVLLACRSWAIEHGEDAGIWGGTTARQRRAISREMRIGGGERPVH
ncbi:WhiB family transcriptional regulator [Streptomyces sp. NPDC055952]|uniref:WhiB family transcriptional regulator n=1 Tax=Streptomyces sp. NPDC055952 TaxID=3345663 RepID=UPI0035E1ABC4